MERFLKELIVTTVLASVFYIAFEIYDAFELIENASKNARVYAYLYFAFALRIIPAIIRDKIFPSDLIWWINRADMGNYTVHYEADNNYFSFYIYRPNVGGSGTTLCYSSEKYPNWRDKQRFLIHVIKMKIKDLRRSDKSS